MNIPVTVPTNLISTYAILKRAFPEGIATEDYLPLLAVMQETGMSDRSIAYALLYYSNDSYNKNLYTKYLYEVSHLLIHSDIPQAHKERVINKLKLFGFEQWKNED